MPYDHIYLAHGLCSMQQRKSSKSHYYFSSLAYGHTHIQFALTHAILVYPPVICSIAFLSFILQPIEHKKGKFDFQNMSTE